MRVLGSQWWVCLPWVALFSCGATGGGGGGGGGGGACDRDLSGSWSISGSCVPSQCAVQQSGCALSISCNDGTRLSGTVAGSSFSGTASSGTTTLSCQGSLSTGTLAGSCRPITSGASSCSFSARCTGGACGAATGGGDDCPTATSCMACTMRSTCGWCDGRCSVGTSTGPRGTVCADNRWAWTLGMCSNDAGP